MREFNVGRVKCGMSPSEVCQARRRCCLRSSGVWWPASTNLCAAFLFELERNRQATSSLCAVTAEVIQQLRMLCRRILVDGAVRLASPTIYPSQPTFTG